MSPIIKVIAAAGWYEGMVIQQAEDAAQRVLGTIAPHAIWIRVGGVIPFQVVVGLRLRRVDCKRGTGADD